MKKIVSLFQRNYDGDRLVRLVRRTGRGVSRANLLKVEVLSIEAWPLPSEFSSIRRYLDYLDGMGPRYRDRKADLLRLVRSIRTK